MEKEKDGGRGVNKGSEGRRVEMLEALISPSLVYHLVAELLSPSAAPSQAQCFFNAHTRLRFHLHFPLFCLASSRGWGGFPARQLPLSRHLTRPPRP